MHFVYILVSIKDKKFYVGMTSNINVRLKNHILGAVPSTKNRRPLKLLGYETYLTKYEAGMREKYLKTNDGRKEMRIRFKKSLENLEVVLK
ncbi:MAG: GIY-YIG nuclease family protein [Patescibacteria group bacterium]|nr:GIY-YIG nuclease family protein [Patescibacteria group bacterium]